MSKKGFSHIEMILSFIIFLGFLFFLFILINPVKLNKPNIYLLETLEFEIQKNVSQTLIKESIKINKGIDKDCFSINHTAMVGNDLKRKVKVRDKGGRDLRVNSSDVILKIENSSDFYQINYCVDFNNTNDTLSNCVYLKEEDGDYTFGSIKDTKVISFKKLLEFNRNYKEGYENLKEKLGLPKNNDFALFIFDSELNSLLEIAPDTKVPTSLNVMSANYNVQILEVNGGWEIKSGILNIRIW